MVMYSVLFLGLCNMAGVYNVKLTRLGFILSMEKAAFIA